MFTRHAVFTLVAMVAFEFSVAAEQATPARTEQSGLQASSGLFSLQQPKRSYEDRFSALADKLRAVQAERGRAMTRPTVVCGMTVIPVDASIDRGIRVSPPATSPRPVIRVVEPPMCREK